MCKPKSCLEPYLSEGEPMKNVLRGAPVVRALLGAALLGVALTGVAAASTVLHFSNEELTKRADVIVHGKCTKATPREGYNKMIVTDYEFDVIELVKGKSDDKKTFRFTALGGKLADRGFLIHGSPSYQTGDECILFLDVPHPKTGCRTAIGLAQGKFAVVSEPGSSKKHLVRELGGLRLVDPNGQMVGIPSPDGPKLYLEEFLKEIKGYLAAPSKEQK
jgi:hypothetical protein